MVEMSSASRAADQGADGPGVGAALKAGEGLAYVFRLRAAIRRSAAFAVSKA